MSLFGAMNTAISGLNSQSAAFSNISENVANSQTVGFKRVDTAFEDILTQSTALVNESGSTVALPSYQNNIQGTIAQTDNPLGLAISGQGFFPVSVSLGESSGGTPNFSSTPAYTRAGDFQMDKNGYLVNSAGSYLNGWIVNSTTGVVNTNSLVPIQVNQNTYNPVATGNINLSANLPANPPINATTNLADPVTSEVTVYDSVGTAHAVTLTWSQVPAGTTSNGTDTLNDPIAATPNTWLLTITGAGDTSTTTAGAGGTTLSTAVPTVNAALVTFGSYTNANGTSVTAPSGTISSVTPYTPPQTVVDQLTGNTLTTAQTGITANPNNVATGVTTTSTYNTSLPATVTFAMDFGDGAQTINLNLGDYGSANGVTQYSGTTYQPHGLTQDGVPPGSYDGVTTTTAGDIVVNYSNGQSRTIAQVPVVTFNAPDGLQSLNGQAYTATTSSGQPNTQNAATNGAGSLVTSSIEQSNVDIATEFSQVIVAQQAYSANTKLISTAQDMLQQTIDMKR
jgi:flagellar hook protein FlgE